MLILHEIKKSLRHLLMPAVFILSGIISVSGQTLLGTRGGLEGSVTVDNTTLTTQGAPNVWQKSTANQTIGFETTIVRSGARSLRILNTSNTSGRVLSPTLDPVANGSPLVLQYYRRRPAGTGQENRHGIVFPPGYTNASFSQPAAADTWEKVTFAPATVLTYSQADKWAEILHRLADGGNPALPLYIDDVAVYVGTSVDNAAPNSPTGTIVGNAMSNSLNVSWTAASGGTDGGGYLVVRNTVDPTTAPNVNGIYDVGNTIDTGTVVYNGTGTSFTDTGLSLNTQYFYRVYTYDKAFNYSAASSGTGRTLLAPTAATVSISGRVMTASGRGIRNVRLTLTDSNGEVRTATTTAFGYYRFDDIRAGETYILSAVGKRFTFSQSAQVLNVNEETTEVNFIADSNNSLGNF